MTFFTRPRFLLSCLVVLASVAQTFAAESRERKLYVGKDSTEATLTFNGIIEINQTTKPSASKIEEAIEDQASYLFGPMGEADIKAVPKGDPKFTNISAPQRKEGTRSTWVVNYTYSGTVVAHNNAKDKYSVIYPINPATIYEDAKVGNKKPCTDHHYDGEGDFWYFWSPERFGCKLEEGVHYLRAEGKLSRSNNTKVTYPEYDRMVRKVGNENVIHMSVLFGMDEQSKNRDPLKSNDVNAPNFRDVRNSLIKMGFSPGQKWKARDIENYFNKNIDSNVYVEELTKQTKKAKLVARLFFGPSGMDEESEAFHYFFKDAIENSALMVYDGHSGLGGHLDLDDMESNEGFKIRFPKDKYQMLFFNSCTSYTYYNTQYFAKKKGANDLKGTKNLDILTNGLATYFSVMHDTNMSVLKAIDLWANGKGAVSYQTLAKEIDSGNLFGVNGDDDNPTSQPR